MERKVEVYPVYARGSFAYGWMRSDSNLIYRSKQEADGTYSPWILNMTQRTFNAISSREKWDTEKRKAVANAYNHYYKTGELDCEYYD